MLTPTDTVTPQSVRGQALALLRRLGTLGATDDELEVLLSRPHQTISARRRELVQMGHAVNSGLVRRTRSGRNAAVWIVHSDAGRQQVQCPMCNGTGVLEQPVGPNGQLNLMR